MASSLKELCRIIGGICWLALALAVCSPAVGQDGAGQASADAPGDGPPAPKVSFDDLYPDAELPDPPKSAVTKDDVENSTPPDSSSPTVPENEPGDEADEPHSSGGVTEPQLPDDVAADLYPDVELPGPAVGDEDNGVDTAEPPPATEAALSQPPDDSFSDLYPDVNLPGQGGQPSGGEDKPLEGDAALIEEIFSGREEEDVPPVQLSSPRDLLAMFDPPIDESQLRSFVDGVPLGDGERGTLTRIIYRLPRFSLEKIHQWQRLDANWDELAAQPDLFRTEFYTVLGRVRKITRVGVIPELEELLRFGHYYQVDFDIDDTDVHAVVCTRNIPNAWIRAHNEGRELNERSGFSGLFLKVGGQQDGQPELVFATRRLAWFPDRADEDLGIDSAQVLLGDLQVDVGLFELTKDGTSLSPTDREAFYQLLDGLKRTNNEQLDGLASQTHDIEKMLMQPKTQRGKLMTIEGNARRVLRLKVDDPDIRERFGLNHYYEIAVFVPLDTRIEIPGDPGEPTKYFDNSYPMIFCVRNLPEGMPRGPDIREPVPVRIPAYYYKLYAYRSQYMSAEDRQRKQHSPLLIGLEPEWIPPEQKANPWFSIALGSLFIVAVAGVWFGLWRYSRSDREFQQTTLSRQYQLSEGTSLNELGIEASNGPDFSHLDEAAESRDPPSG